MVEPLLLGENAARYYPGENAATFNWRKCSQWHFVTPAFSPDPLSIGNLSEKISLAVFHRWWPSVKLGPKQ